jgi:hypothetical protein
MTPKLNVNTALAVTDGQTTSGYIMKCGSAFYSYGADHVLIGEFRTQAEASRAIPVASTPPQRGAHRRARSRTTTSPAGNQEENYGT